MLSEKIIITAIICATLIILSLISKNRGGNNGNKKDNK